MDSEASWFTKAATKGDLYLLGLLLRRVVILSQLDVAQEQSNKRDLQNIYDQLEGVDVEIVEWGNELKGEESAK